MKRTEEFFLINKQINSAKRFRKFEHISNRENDFIEIVYDCVIKFFVSLSIKGVKLKLLDEAKKNIKSLRRSWNKTNIFKSIY